MEKIVTVLVMMMVSFAITAQKDIEFLVGGDIVSSYIWRGAYQTETSLPPSIGLEIDNFSFPVFGQVITNPGSEDTFLVFGLCL